MAVGFVGAGRMGLPMVRRLVAAGHPVRVSALSNEEGSLLTREGATPVFAVRAVADDAAVVIICVYSDEQVRQVAFDEGLIDAMEPGSVLVVHTTCSPRTVQALAEYAATHGVQVVDSPISGGPDDIAAGRITSWQGGDPDDVQRIRPYLNSYADPMIYVGAVGSGQTVKLLNNAVFAANVALAVQAARIATELGFDEKAAVEAMRYGSSDSKALAMIAASPSSDTFVEMVREFLGKDVVVVRRITHDIGVDLGPIGDVLDSDDGRSVLGVHIGERAPS
ncbi:NAD(P)-dependent oxidoreductase [Gordonia rhizosphera]|uniref:Putative oxidoreductase n=1 Tax=Gordonia rhizosphera NBRC 16068 TaxID=1108045 RepID=K6WT69_9ACTN|nr:NAD(P)-dependent oxidoreductase [Gordonia rhizosphera]GAB89749.1 putative oxidoreductase [Gordonia rhizosphera NBRC 16068]